MAPSVAVTIIKYSLLHDIHLENTPFDTVILPREGTRTLVAFTKSVVNYLATRKLILPTLKDK